MATKTKSKRKGAKLPEASAGRVSNAKLPKLAAKRRPPQSWHDEQTDPTKPATAGH